jgi:Spy/CpxP family protein refolding chaperone
LQQNRDALAAAVKANDTPKIQQISLAQGNLRGQVLTIRAGALAQFYQILTPDQRTKADQLQQRIRQRLQQRRQGANG